jgi:hypothetical protein
VHKQDGPIVRVKQALEKLIKNGSESKLSIVRGRSNIWIAVNQVAVRVTRLDEFSPIE